MSAAALVNGNGDAHASLAFLNATVPPSGSKIGVRIVHIENLNCFYVVPEAELARLEHQAAALKSLATKCEPLAGAASNQTVSCLLAMHPDDGLWYRVVALAWPSPDVYLVRFVDYGNCAVVPAEFVAKQPAGSTLAEQPAAAIGCRLADCDHRYYGPNALASFRKLLNRPNLIAEFVPDESGDAASADCFSRLAGVRLSINGIDVLGKLTKLANPMPLPRRRVTIPPAENIVNVGAFDAVISVASPRADNAGLTVWLQRSDRQEDLQQLSELLDPAAETSAGFSITDLVVGDICVGYYQEGWYRARVESVDEAAATVGLVYIDYGNAESKSLRGTFQQVRRLPPGDEFLQPAFAFRATLPSPTPPSQWKPDAGELLVGMTEEQAVAEEEGGDNGEATSAASVRVSVSSDGVVQFEDPAVIAAITDVVEPRQRDVIPDFDIAAPVAFDAVLIVADLTDDRRSAVVWLQRDSDQEALTSLQEALEAAAGEQPPLTSKELCVGDACIGLYEDAWYRARVVSCSPTSVSVLFVDYGNVESADTPADLRLRRLPPGEPKFLAPAFALRCRLDCPADGCRFKPDAGAALIARTEETEQPLLVSLKLPVGDNDGGDFVVRLDEAERDFFMQLVDDGEADDEAVNQEAADDEAVNQEAADEVNYQAESNEEGDQTIVEDDAEAEDAATEDKQLLLKIGDSFMGSIVSQDENDDTIFYIRREDSVATEARARLNEALADVADVASSADELDTSSFLVIKNRALLRYYSASSHDAAEDENSFEWRRVQIESIDEHGKSVEVVLIDDGVFLSDTDVELFRPMPEQLQLSVWPAVAYRCQLQAFHAADTQADFNIVKQFEILGIVEDEQEWPMYSVRPVGDN